MSKGIETGTDNVFADLGLADAGERQMKTRLAMMLYELIKARGLKQTDTARLLGIPQPKVSALVNFRLDGFSVERMLGFLTAMDQDIEIVVRPARMTGAGQVSVHALR